MYDNAKELHSKTPCKVIKFDSRNTFKGSPWTEIINLIKFYQINASMSSI